MEISEARKKANKKWDQAHKEVKQRSNTKSTAKRFVREMATPEEWAELVEIYNNKHKSDV